MSNDTEKEKQMKKFGKKTLALVTGLVAALTIAAAAFAAVTFDPATGTGFVGKGDVQLVYGWNNKQLQDNAGSVQFRANSVSETEWTCSRPAPTPNDPDREIVQERSSETTTQGLVDSIARERNQITGFNLLGYDGTPTVTTDGPAVGSCPANPSGFEYDNNAVTTPVAGGGLEVSIDGTNWSPLS
jgi:opacity protein-like surface antigen